MTTWAPLCRVDVSFWKPHHASATVFLHTRRGLPVAYKECGSSEEHSDDSSHLQAPGLLFCGVLFAGYISCFSNMKLRNSFFCGFSIFHGSGFQTEKLSAKPSGSQMMASYLYLNDVLIITCTAALAFTSVTQIPFFVTQLCTSSNAVISVSSFSLRHFLLQKTQHSGCRGAELVPPSLIDCSFPLSCSSIFIREGF